MRELPLSLPEKKFILAAAAESKRLDGRKLDEFREFDIHFGKEWGSCFVTLGETKVLANVSCEVQEPREVRANEGFLYINVEVSAMAAPHFASASRSELGVHLNRMLEKCLKESRAVDLESLCIVADEKVWAIRVDVNVINHEGNLLDCCSVAALTALAHFKRPDVTIDGTQVNIHDATERDPIPITLHHYPLCVSFAYFSNGDKILSDPTALEERVLEASLVLGVNAYRELCALYLGGSSVVAPRVIMRCATHAAIRAKHVVEIVKNRLAQDAQERDAKRPVGFATCCASNKITSFSQDRVKIQLGKFRLSMPLESAEKMDVAETQPEILNLGNNTAELIDEDVEIADPFPEPQKYGEGGPSQWIVEIASPPIELKNCHKETIPNIESITLEEDSDEETVHLLNSTQLAAAERVPTQKQPRQKKRRTKKN